MALLFCRSLQSNFKPAPQLLLSSKAFGSTRTGSIVTKGLKTLEQHFSRKLQQIQLGF